MKIRAFFDCKDFFGNWQYSVDNDTAIFSPEQLTDALRKCFYSFGRVRNFSFRIETREELYLVEQSTDDTRNAVYTVTHIYGRSNDTPEKMSAAAIRKLARDMLVAAA